MGGTDTGRIFHLTQRHWVSEREKRELSHVERGHEDTRF